MTITKEAIEACLDITLSSVDMPAAECLHANDVREILEAALPFLPIAVEETFGSDSYYFKTVKFDGSILYEGDDLPSAQAAAQADHDAFILSALVSSPGKDGGQEVEELRREIASLQYRLDEANGHLRRFEEGQEVEAKRWLVEETLPSGSVRWSVFEHEHQAKLEAAKATATVTPLYTRPQPASTALVEKGGSDD